MLDGCRYASVVVEVRVVLLVWRLWWTELVLILCETISVYVIILWLVAAMAKMNVKPLESNVPCTAVFRRLRRAGRDLEMAATLDRLVAQPQAAPRRNMGRT